VSAARFLTALGGLLLLAVGADVLVDSLWPEPTLPDCERCGRRRCAHVERAALCVPCCLVHVDGVGEAQLAAEAGPGWCHGCQARADVVHVRWTLCAECAADAREELRESAVAGDQAATPPEQ
jgi:hypothetical protein